MLDTAPNGLQQDTQPKSLKYHIIRSGGSDYYLTTNPNQKHIHDPIGPSYYVRVSAASRGSGLKSNLASKDAQNESDGSFSVIILVHDYDNVSVSAHSNEDGEQSVKYNEQSGLLIPIMHIRRIDGESKMTVTVLDNGENIWETVVALHSDPYTGESKFVFLDPWDRRWSLEGKDGITCTSSLYDEPISNLERKLLAESKVGWITLESPALKMLDLMVGVNMAVFCFRNYELNPSRLTTVATGILHADLNTVKTSQTTTKKKKGGFKLYFTKKKETKSIVAPKYDNNAQTGNVISAPSSEDDRNQHNRIKESQEHPPSAPLRGNAMPADRQLMVSKLRRKPAMRNNGSLEEPLPAVLPAFAYQTPYPALPGFSVSVPKSDGIIDGFVRASYHEARSQSGSGYSTPSSIECSARQPIYMSLRVDDQKASPIYEELRSQPQHQSRSETFTPPVHTKNRHDFHHTQTETTKPPPVRTHSQSSIEHLVSRQASLPPRVEQQQTPPTEAEIQSQPLHHYPRIRTAAQSQVQHPIQPERRTPSRHLEQPRSQMSPEPKITPPHSPYDASTHSGNKNPTGLSRQRRHPSILLASRMPCQQSAMLSSSSNSSASVAPDCPRRDMLSSSASNPSASQGHRHRPNSTILPASTNANGNSTANQSHQYMSGEEPRRNDRRVLQRGATPPRTNTQTLSSAPKSSGEKKKNRLSMMAFVSKFQ
ncbi:uncharacterized protein V1513DRAFT_416194 [Lipomyces chichibuensis]|uniref:uncharacterized protein n=1 Tax=Lipomyces chichibuensis TaxID=1546026 RepID=UPI0033441D57